MGNTRGKDQNYFVVRQGPSETEHRPFYICIEALALTENPSTTPSAQSPMRSDCSINVFKFLMDNVKCLSSAPMTRLILLHNPVSFCVQGSPRFHGFSGVVHGEGKREGTYEIWYSWKGPHLSCKEHSSWRLHSISIDPKPFAMGMKSPPEEGLGVLYSTPLDPVSLNKMQRALSLGGCVVIVSTGIWNGK